MVRLTRGRLWIGILAALLVGIVALNVMALSFSASSSEAGRQADALKRQNSAYVAQLATLTSSEEVLGTAERLGLYVPRPNQIGYLRPSPEDATAAAKRLRSGELSATSFDPAATAPIETAPIGTTPLPEETVPVETTPTETATAETAPVEATPDPTAGAAVAGAVSAP